MPRFLTTSGITHEIENITRNAQGRLTLVTPYLKLSTIFFDRLKDADEKGIQIEIIYGKVELKEVERQKLYSLGNIKIFYKENLHAKCYFNEESMVITSMNLHEYSEKSNVEMGIHITKSDDKIIYIEASQEADSIRRRSKLIFEGNNYKKNQNSNHSQDAPGYCIRCGSTIEYNTDAPFCYPCFKGWVTWENYEYQERFCHNCGNEDMTSMRKPLCYNCFSVESKSY